MTQYITVVPAYGVDFKSKKAVEEHYLQQKDFLIQDISSPHDGRYINRKDAENIEGKVILKIRYKSLREVHMLDVTKLKGK